MNRDHVQAVLSGLEVHGSLRELQRRLRTDGLASGRNWSEIAASIWDARSYEALDEAESYLAEVILFGSKSFQLLSIPREFKEAARIAARENESLSSSEIAALELGNAPRRIERRGFTHDQSSLSLLFRSKKTLSRVVEIESEWMLPQHRVRVEDADKAYLVETITVPVVEVVEIPFGPRHGSIRLVTSMGGYAAKESPGAAATRLLALTGEALGMDATGLQALDLFSAIRNIYNNPGEGRVVEMHFDCSTGAGRTERMRRSPTDLRREAYHRAGVQAADISPYRLAVRWDESAFGEAEVLIPGTRRMLHQTQRPRLVTASMTRPAGAAAFQHAMLRIAANL